MPAYGTTVVALMAGDTFKAFDAETPANGTKSKAIALPPYISELGIDIYYASAPAATDYKVEVADEDVEARYREIAQSTNTSGERITIGVVDFKFLRIHKVSQTAGGAVTVTVSGKRNT